MSQSFIKQLYPKFKLDKGEINAVLCHVLGINSAALFIYDQQISETQQKCIIKFLRQREKGVPLAYLTGFKAFWTLELSVNQSTLIPRPETELIVELLLETTAADFSGKLLDLGTGTGAIALSFAQERPNALVTATDFSESCIEIAELNKQKYQLNNVTIIQSDWFKELSTDKYDYIVSNPPYIAEGDEHLQQLTHEPITALTAENNGLADLFHIIEYAKHFLKKKGQILLEHGYDQHLMVQQHLALNGYTDIHTHRDLANIPRITTAHFSNQNTNEQFTK